MRDFAENLHWAYHSIPFLTAVLGLVLGDAVASSMGPLANTIFPPVALIVGGYAGLVVLGEISDREETEEKRTWLANTPSYTQAHYEVHGKHRRNLRFVGNFGGDLVRYSGQQEAIQGALRPLRKTHGPVSER